MKNEIVVSIVFETEEVDISVDPDIRVHDLMRIIGRRFRISKDYFFYSMNHSKKLNSDKSLSDELIWDGDILEIHIQGG
ncbi:MAG: hypothetical protein PHF65_07040 [Oscillospiraceae bacterium]|nr:hypothetical protein [Oscillospiraceae bacterium]